MVVCALSFSSFECGVLIYYFLLNFFFVLFLGHIDSVVRG